MTTPKIDRTRMTMLDPKITVDPFAKINYEDTPQGRVVLAYMKTDVTREGTKIGLAIDGSASMEDMFGRKQLSSFLPPNPNHVAPAAQAICEYLIAKASDGKVATIYWACGPAGAQIEVQGDLDQSNVQAHPFSPPNHYGTETQLLPALTYFLDGQQRADLANAPFGFFVFITDGQINDFDAVTDYCTQLAKDIEAGRRNEVKLVIVGLGPQVDEDQLDGLDDLETGTDVDLWDAKLASELSDLSSLFDEVKEGGDILVPNDGVIKDANGNVIMDFRDSGLPAVIEFVLPDGGQSSFSLEVAGNSISQDLG